MMSTFSVNDETIAPRSAQPRPRVANDQRDVVGAVEIAALADQPVVADLLAVIRSEDDERRVPAPRFLQESNQPSDLGVNPAHQSVVNRLQPPQSLLIVGRAKDSARQLMREPRMLAGFIFGRGQTREARHLRGIVHRVVRLGRDERRMRPQQREVRDERPLALLDVVDRLADQERGVVELRRILERLGMRRAVFVVGTVGAIAIGEADVRRHLETLGLQPIGPRRRRAVIRHTGRMPGSGPS